MERKVKVIDEFGHVGTYVLEDAPTILTAFEDAGYYYPHGCRVGVCGACASEVVEGSDLLAAEDGIETERLADFRRQDAESGKNQLVGRCIRLMCRAGLNADVTLRPLSGMVVLISQNGDPQS
ncbi:MAG: (2Fe-2S)-binding protein [Deltaproteobacteria bacterium]|nr:(2Fe-2S)-binding protein [Deltaproteobacteria bacterium]MBN2672384.1 (2Fe-2S)-binding protein [Deltaproteobacteria bacterium]